MTSFTFIVTMPAFIENWYGPARFTKFPLGTERHGAGQGKSRLVFSIGQATPGVARFAPAGFGKFRFGGEKILKNFLASKHRVARFGGVSYLMAHCGAREIFLLPCLLSGKPCLANPGLGLARSRQLWGSAEISALPAFEVWRCRAGLGRVKRVFVGFGAGQDFQCSVLPSLSS